MVVVVVVPLRGAAMRHSGLASYLCCAALTASHLPAMASLTADRWKLLAQPSSDGRSMIALFSLCDATPYLRPLI